MKSVSKAQTTFVKQMTFLLKPQYQPKLHKMKKGRKDQDHKQHLSDCILHLVSVSY